MTLSFHDGELSVQAQAGVQEQAHRIGQSIKATMPIAAQAFLREQPLALVGARDARGQVWASLLTGAAGFMEPRDERTVHIRATPAPGDPLWDTLRVGAAVGLLAIDLASRRRMRVNGMAALEPDGGFVVHAQQVYANCPKYIQARHLERVEHAPARGIAQHGQRLTSTQQDWIAGADTLFIASAHPVGGADVSHRGGRPGFVQVVDATTLLLPDYAGNTMFQTLGNIQAHPQVGLLLLDFAQGGTLQVSGTARIIWDQERVATVAGAQCLVEIHISATIELAHASSLRATSVVRSPFNPA